MTQYHDTDGSNLMKNSSAGRGLCALLTALGLLLTPGSPAAAADYPDRPISFIVTSGAGSAMDLAARSLTGGAEKHLGQAIVVENKVGGGGAVGVQYILSKPADGYTIGIASINPLIISYHTGTLAANPVNELSHIMRTTGYLFALAVRADAPWKSVEELIQYAKANPGKLSYTSSGVGSTGNLNMEEFALLAGIQVTHVPYKSGSESNTAVLGGHVHALSDAAWAPLVQAGRFRVLLIYANERSPRYPQVPVPRDVVSANVQPGYLLLIAPKDLPKPIVKRLHDAFRLALDEPAHKAVLDRFNLEPLYLNSEDSKKAVSDAMEPLGKLAAKLGLGKM
jgi:tripartite-type tricarboxylate transporter receptor subunit TctC